MDSCACDADRESLSLPWGAVGFVGWWVCGFGGRRSRESRDGMNGVVLFFFGGVAMWHLEMASGVRGQHHGWGGISGTSEI